MRGEIGSIEEELNERKTWWEFIVWKNFNKQKNYLNPIGLQVSLSEYREHFFLLMTDVEVPTNCEQANIGLVALNCIK